GRYLILTIWKGTDARYRITYKDLKDPDAKFVDLVTDFENDYSFIDNVGSVFYFKTDLKAPRKRVIAVDTKKPARSEWKEVIPQAKESLQGVHCVGDLLICSYLKDARTPVKMYDMGGKFVRELELPGIGSAGGFACKRTDQETFYTFSSFATPPSIYRYDLEKGKSTVFRTSKVKFKPDDYEVKQVFYKSKD